MVIIRSKTISFNCLENLANALDREHKEFSYYRVQAFLQNAEQIIFHPNLDQVSKALQDLQEHYQKKIEPAYAQYDLHPKSESLYHALSRTYRVQHDDFYLCTAVLELKIDEDVAVRRLLISYDERYGRSTVTKESRLTHANDTDIPNLQEYLSERLGKSK
jgi:hypothetical protein